MCGYAPTHICFNTLLTSALLTYGYAPDGDLRFGQLLALTAEDDLDVQHSRVSLQVRDNHMPEYCIVKPV